MENLLIFLLVILVVVMLLHSAEYSIKSPNPTKAPKQLPPKW